MECDALRCDLRGEGRSGAAGPGRECCSGMNRVEVWRGAAIESEHRVHVAVVDASGRLRAAAGDCNRIVFARSSVKPLQALPLVEDGAAERFGFGGHEIALCCASHSGEPKHVAGVRAMLQRIGVDESALACGPHMPLHEPSARALRQTGRQPGRIHNNCSGKHAGMLALAWHHGWPIAGYEQAEHPVQQRIRGELAAWTGMPADEMVLAVDGCGVVTFALPIEALARGFAGLAAAARRGATAAATVVSAMTEFPYYVAGTGRLCTALMRLVDGRIVAKTGAEGVYCAAVPGAELGVAIKVEDGATRASEPALIEVLRQLGLLADHELSELLTFAQPVIRNTRGEETGRIVARIELEAKA